MTNHLKGEFTRAKKSDFSMENQVSSIPPQRVSQITPFINYRNIILQLPRRADLVTIFRNPYTQIFQIPHASRFASTILDIGTQTIVDYHELCRNNKPLPLSYLPSTFHINFVDTYTNPCSHPSLLKLTRSPLRNCRLRLGG